MPANTPDPLLSEPNAIIDGTRVLAFVFTIAIYSREPFSRHAKAILGLQKRFLDLCPPSTSWYYATENMSRHKPATSRTHGMLGVWLKPGAPAREFIALEIKDGAVFNAAPEFKFEVRGTEPGSPSFDGDDANLITLSFPAAWATERTDVMKALALEAFSAMPVVSGHAGYSFELSRYFQSGAEALGWKHSMRHRGIDVARPSEDRGAVSTDGLKTVSWLTLLGKSLLVSLGGQRVLSALPSSVIVHDLPTGVALEAGPQPIAGESAKPKDLASYKAVFKVVRPLIERVVARYPAMWLLGGIKIEPTRAWLLRLER